MKLLRLTSAYPAYLREFYRRRRSLRRQPYAAQLKELNDDAFGWADFWVHALAPLGYSVWDITANAKPMQMAWAEEHGVRPSAERWLVDIASAQVLNFAPEVLFMDDYANFSASWIRDVRAACPSIRLVVGWCGAPYDDDSVFGAYDVVLSCIPELVREFRDKGHKTFHLNHAFDPRIAARLPVVERDIDLSFVGQLSVGREAHHKRLEILSRLSKEVRLQIHSPQTSRLFDLSDGPIPYLVKDLIRIPWYHAYWTLRRAGVPVDGIPYFRKALKWTKRPRMNPIPRSPIAGMQPGLFGMDMFRLLRQSKLTFNSHIDVSRESASNMRLFEATGSGACLVTDWKQNLGELFEPDTEVVTYRSAAECVEKVKWLLEHSRQSAQIADAGAKRTLEQHTFAHRAPELDKIIRQHL